MLELEDKKLMEEYGTRPHLHLAEELNGMSCFKTL